VLSWQWRDEHAKVNSGKNVNAKYNQTKKSPKTIDIRVTTCPEATWLRYLVKAQVSDKPSSSVSMFGAKLYKQNQLSQQQPVTNVQRQLLQQSVRV